MKNLLGWVLIVVGIALLFLPGPGIVSIILGLSLARFPGRKKLEAMIISHPKIGKNINKLREKYHTPPFDLPPDESEK